MEAQADIDIGVVSETIASVSWHLVDSSARVHNSFFRRALIWVDSGFNEQVKGAMKVADDLL